MEQTTNNTEQKPPVVETPLLADVVKDIEDNKILAAISYIGIISLVVLLLKKDSKFAQFHAKQGLVLCIISFLSWFPILGWALGLVIFVFAVIGIVQAASGKYWEMPLIGDLAKKINL